MKPTIDEREARLTRNRQISIVFSTIILLSGAIAIGFVEKTIQINHLDTSAGPITAAGQLIPLVIGTNVLFRTITVVIRKSLLRAIRWIKRRRSLSRAILSIYKSLPATYHRAKGSIKVFIFGKRDMDQPSLDPAPRKCLQETTTQDMGITETPISICDS